MSILSRLVELIRTTIPSEKLFLVDVGAAEGIQPRWLPFAPLIKGVGFEPNPVEFEKLKSSADVHWVNAAVAGSDGPRTIHLTRIYNNSSLLVPNLELIEQLEWSDHADCFDIVSNVEVNCVTLDHAAAHLHPCFLKLDTQGSEREILLASQQILDEDLVMIEVEVAFSELYESQPQFCDIDRLIRAHGFYLQDLANLLFIKPRGLGGVGGPKGRLIQADALYYKRPELLVEASDRRIAGALVSYMAYGYPELGLQLLDVLSAAGRTFPQAGEIRSRLRAIKHSSAFFSWIPGWGFIAQCCKRLWLGVRPVSHSLWETELGNRI
jgi:FkbM family methyltransferase